MHIKGGACAWDGHGRICSKSVTKKLSSSRFVGQIQFHFYHRDKINILLRVYLISISCGSMNKKMEKYLTRQRGTELDTR